MNGKISLFLGAMSLSVYAESAQSLAFASLLQGPGVDGATAQQYLDCLQAEWRQKAAFELSSAEDVREASQGGECGVECGKILGVDLVVSASLSTSKFGYTVTMNMLEVESGKTDRIDWNVIGTKKDLMLDGCKNGAAVVYNYQVTPDAKVAIKLPAGYNAETARDQGLKGGINNDMILVKERAAAERGKAMNQKNPDSKNTGGEKGGR